MDDLARSWRLLLIAFAACSPAKGEPVGVSHGGAEHEALADASTPTAMLDGFPATFRTTWTKIGARIPSEHGQFTVDVYTEGHARYAEDLFAANANAGVYLIERSDAGGARFAVTDATGHAIGDTASDAGASLEACTRCHAGARDAVFPIASP